MHSVTNAPNPTSAHQLHLAVRGNRALNHFDSQSMFSAAPEQIFEGRSAIPRSDLDLSERLVQLLIPGFGVVADVDSADSRSAYNFSSNIDFQ